MALDHEFLPLCDLLFNIISLGAYFCDVVFDIIMCYALYNHGYILWSALTLSFILLSLITSQVVSLRWHLRASVIKNGLPEKTDLSEQNSSQGKSSLQISDWLIAVLHFFQCGVLWRYFKLFVPVDLRFVKHEVRDLCLLRLQHAFCESAPMLLLQLYLLWQESSMKELTDLNKVSTVLSLFNVCWALASFSKNVRLHNIHRLVLTWLGVISQFFWRLGTVWSRVTALTVYATLYGPWTLLVVILHWVCMLLWLLSPKNAFHGERLSPLRKVAFSALIAFVYVFAYINLQEVSHRQKMAIFYVVMFLENSLLIGVWLVGVWADPPWYYKTVPLLVFGAFVGGICFMALYYRFFHVQRLRYESGGRNYDSYSSAASKVASYQSTLEGNSSQSKDSGRENGSRQSSEEAQRTTRLNVCNNVSSKYQNRFGYTRTGVSGPGGIPIPGVFNCRFANPYGGGSSSAAALKRKKKKPTTFVPPPSIGSVVGQSNGECKQSQIVGDDLNAARCLLQLDNIPFWCRPLSRQRNNHQGCSSENEGSSVSSRVNIQQKLQEKKQKQLAELRVIEEEIKQGKLQRPTGGSGAPGPETPLRGPPMSLCWPAPSPPPPPPSQPPQPYLLPPPPRAKHHGQRANTPEILLAPHYLDSSRVYYEWCSGAKATSSIYSCTMNSSHNHPIMAIPSAPVDQNGTCKNGGPVDRDRACSPSTSGLPAGLAAGLAAGAMYLAQRPPSDVESQASLPRSYTLPREFKYYRQPKTRKAVRTEHFVASTNSSDGDVDSGDENDSGESSQLENETLPQKRPVLRPRPPTHILRGCRGPAKHETKL